MDIETVLLREVLYEYKKLIKYDTQTHLFQKRARVPHIYIYTYMLFRDTLTYFRGHRSHIIITVDRVVRVTT